MEKYFLFLSYVFQVILRRSRERARIDIFMIMPYTVLKREEFLRDLGFWQDVF